MAGGDGQVAPAGAPLPNPLVVLVTDDAGDPVAGVTVQWTAGGEGAVSPGSVQTGSDGKASTTRTLGATAGQQTTTAAVTGLQGSPVTFTATATDGATPGITITTNPPTAALTGEVFDPVVQPVVQVRDGAGQPMAGVQVEASVASGGGTLEGTTTATTDASGVAKFGDLGISGTGAQTLEFTAGTSSVTSAPVDLSPLPTEATTGKWGPLVNWDIVPLHLHLLPTGKLLAWGKFEPGGTVMGMPRLWDPASGPPTGAREIAVDTMLFCSGHAFMPDGRLMISGGHKEDDEGIDVTNIFDPASESLRSGSPQDGVRALVSDGHRASRRPDAHHGRAGLRRRGGDDAGDLGGRPVGQAAGRRNAADPVLPAQLHRPEERPRLHGRRADHVALVRPGRDRSRRRARALDQRAVAHLAVQPGLRHGGDVRAGQDPGRRRRG